MNHYDLLGVSRTASKQEIKKGYKKLAMKHHPVFFLQPQDKNSSNKQQAKQKFTKISEAYAVLSDPVKRQQYDDSLDNKNVFVSVNENFQREQYNWKNPEFDPSYNHFAKQQRRQTSNVGNSDFKLFEKFDMNFRFPLFKKNFMDVEFGGFTFEMAEEIFNEVFDQMEKKNPMKSLMSNQISSPSDTLSKRYSSSYSYQPKNSSLMSQKTIERNGKRVLVKKYSITEDGLTRTETHEQIIH